MSYSFTKRAGSLWLLQLMFDSHNREPASVRFNRPYEAIRYLGH